MLLNPLPLSQTVTPSRTPSTPSSVTYFMDGPTLYSTLNVYEYSIQTNVGPTFGLCRHRFTSKRLSARFRVG